MHDDDLWQVYADNGAPISGKGASADVFDADKSLNMGNAHIWFWQKNTDGQMEIMLRNVARLRSGRAGSIFRLAAI
jgi:hypothetical protein